MFRHFVPRIFLSVLVVTPAAAADSSARIVVQCVDGGECPVQGTLKLTSPADPSRSVNARVQNGVVLLDAPLAGWTAELEGAGFWMPPQIVTGADTQSLTAWRTTIARGRFVVAREDGDMPSAFQLAIESLPGARGATIGGARIECPVATDGSWSCAVPATSVDVVLRAKTFTPQYRWAVALSAAQPYEFGRIVLRRGASLVAWLESGSLKALEKPAVARLFRMAVADPSPAGVRLSEPVAEATFNARGMVQLTPVAAGTYRLEVGASGFATTRVEPVEIYERSETTLRHAIELAPPVTLRLSVVPPLDPAGKPWRLNVSRRDPVLSRMQQVASGVATTEGSYVVPEQSPGQYTVSIRDSTENRYANHTFNVDRGPESQHTFEVKNGLLNGKITLGDDPIAATLHFGGRDGAVRIESVADADGVFAVTLPRKGRWPVAVQSANEGVTTLVEIDVKDDEPIEIRLPDSEIAGWVIGADGRRVPGATITLLMHSRAVETHAAPDGTFRLRGVPAGSFRVQATDRRAGEKSNAVPVVVSEGTRIADLELSTIAERDIGGVVVSNGLPVAGARVMAYPAGGGSIEKAVTSTDGAFRLSLPVTATDMVFIVAAAGRTFHGYRLPVSSDAPVRLQLAPAGGTLRLRVPAGSTRRRIVYNDAALLMSEVAQWAFAYVPSQSPFIDAPPGTRSPDDPLVVPHMAPGPYRLCALVPNDGERCRDGVLAAGGALDLFLN